MIPQWCNDSTKLSKSLGFSLILNWGTNFNIMDKLNEFKELAVKAVSQITLARQFAIDNNLTNTKDFIDFEDLLNYLSVLDPNKELAKLPDKIGVEKR